MITITIQYERVRDRISAKSAISQPHLVTRIRLFNLIPLLTIRKQG